jgi:hypothetical protein
MKVRVFTWRFFLENAGYCTRSEDDRQHVEGLETYHRETDT